MITIKLSSPEALMLRLAMQSTLTELNISGWEENLSDVEKENIANQKEIVIGILSQMVHEPIAI